MKKSKIPAISLDKAKKDKLFYFVVTGIIYHPRLKKCLILQRSKRETAHPGLWGVTGGKLEHGDFLKTSPTSKNHEIWDFGDIIEKLLTREAKEESGLVVGEPRIVSQGGGFIRPDGVPVVLYKYGLKWKSGKVNFDKNDFDNFAWVDEKEAREYEIIDGIDKEIAATIKAYSSEKK